MAQKIVNLGNPDRGNGDPLRTAFNKINENFTELYTALGLDNSTLNLGSFEFTGNVISTTDSSSVVVDQAVSLNSNLTVSGDILPNVANSGDLGSLAKPWRSLYVSENTVYFGGVPLSLDAETNELKLNNVPLSQTITYTDIPNVPTDIADLTDTQGLLGGGGGSANTGDITFAATTISAPNEAEIVVQSKDSNSFGTARVTLNSEFSGDARLRAFSSESVDTFTLANGDFTTGVWRDNGFGNGVVEFTGAQGIGDFFQNTLFKLTADNVTISINGGTPFVWNGGASGAGTDTPGFGTNPIVPATPVTITSIEFRYRSESFISVNYDNQEIRLNVQNGGIVFDANNTIQMFGDSNIELQSGENFSINSGQDISIGTGSSNSINLSTGDLNLNAFDDIRIEGRDSFRLINSSAIASIRIITDDDNNSYTWAFNPNGTVTFPDATVQTTAFTGVANIARNIESENDVSIRVNLTDSTTRIWRFGEDGNLTLPGGGNINGSDYDISIIAGDNGDNIYGTVSLVTNSFVGPGTNSLTFNSLGEITVSTVGANDGLVKWVGNSSGDGNGYTTMVLVPDTTVEGNDQYLIIDPTAPSHIHIRAGGTQDASNAELYLGGEKNNVRINDGVGVRLYNEVRDDTFSSFSDPADFNTATWYGTPGNYFVQFTEVTAGMGNLAFQFSNDAENRVTVSYGAGETSVLTYGGSASNLGGGVYRFAVVEAPPASPTVLTAIEFQIWTTNNNRIELQNNDFTVSVKDDVRITGNDIFSLRNTSSTEPITIRTDYDGADRGWEFAADGTLSTPGDIVVNGDVTGTAGGSTLVLRAEPGSNTVLQLNDIVDSEIRTAANFEIRTDVNNTPNVWTFGTDGSLTFPDSTVQTTAYPGPLTFLNGDVKGSVFADDSTLLVDAVNGTIPYAVLSGAPSLGNFTFNSNTLSTTTGSLDIAVGNKTYSFINNTEFGLNYFEIPGYIQGGLQTSFMSSNGLGIAIDGSNPPNTVDIGNISSSTVLRLKDGVGAGNIIVQSLGTSLKLQTNNNSTWEFNDNTGLTFPDATIQTTAFTGTADNIASEDAVEIRVNLTDSTTHIWRFGEDGNLTLPGELYGAPVMSVGPTPSQVGRTVNITPADDASDKKFRFRIDQYAGQLFTRAYLELPTAEVDKQVAAVFPHTNNTSGFIFTQGADTVDDGLNNAFNIFYNAGDIKLTAMTPVTGTLNTWKFGKDGILTLPAGGDIVDSTGTSVLGGGGSGSVLEEPFESKTTATGVVTHDATTNRLFYHTSISANFTANFTNLGLAANEATSLSLVLVQGATARMCTAVQIGGAAQTIVWQGSATAPLGNANRTDVVTFSILCTATDTYTVLGMLTSFGG